MTLRVRWPWLLALFACRGDGCRCRGQQDDSTPPESRLETGDDTACDARVWYADNDGDGYGDAASPVEACEQPALTATNDLDCDDDDALTWPGAPVVCNDLTDNDCDGVPDCATAEGDAAPEDANAVLTGGEGSYLGIGMALTDFDGDGIHDLAVSDPEYRTSGSQDGVYLVRGPLIGTGEVSDAAFARIGSDEMYYTGVTLQAGDLDADSYPDLALAQGTADDDGAWLAYGPFDGEVSLDDDPAVYIGVADDYDGTRIIEPWVADVIGDDGQADLIVRMSINSDGQGSIFALEGPVTEAGDLGEQAASVFGSGGEITDRPNAFAVVGDLDADGRLDLAMDKGLMCASFDLPGGTFTTDDFCDAYLSNEDTDLGSQFADAGDIDGDGYADVIASTVPFYWYAVEQGRARIYSGANLTAAAPGGALDHDTGYLAELDDVQNGDNQLGHGMASPGDLNADGYGEILVTAPTWATRNDPYTHYGAAFLWYGPLEGKLDPEDSADWTLTSTDEDAWFVFRALAAPADAQNNATILLSAWPFEGTSTVYQFTPGGY